MSKVYVTSDWHFGHSGITNYFRKQFPSVEYMEDYILGNMLASVTKRDILYILGDIAFTDQALDKIGNANFPCRLKMIHGNHDTLQTSKYLQVFESVEGAVAYKGYILTHVPIHPNELYRWTNIHGHCHRGGPYETEKDTRYFNAILEFNNYLPIDIREVGTIIKERNNKIMELQSERTSHSRKRDKLKGSL